MYLKAVEIREEVLGEDNIEVAKCLTLLADLYIDELRNYHAAEKCYLQALPICKLFK